MITPGRVKICSLRRPEHAQWVVEASADMFGLIFVEHAWRRIDPAAAREVVLEALRLRGTHPLRSVGVFVGSSVDEINATADRVGLDLVQINERELPDDITRIERPVIAVMRPEAGIGPAAAADRAQAIYSLGDRIEAVLLDAPSITGNGGLGEKSDWDLARHVALRFPVGLAGGLTPENVSTSIDVVAPHLVDVSTGVETEREKDRDKIIAFVANARTAFADASIRQMNFIPLG